MSSKTFIRILSLLIGILAGIAAVLIKYAVHFTKSVLTLDFIQDYSSYLYFLFPIIGITLTLIVIKYFIRDYVGHGIPSVLHALSKDHGKIKKHNMYSSIVTSALTVGFGGSVGLEGPTIATSGAIASNIGTALRLNYKQLILLLGAASAGGMAAIFKAPIAGVVFALEVIMIDMTMASIVPLLIASATGALTSMFFLGVDFIYPIQLTESYHLSELPYYILLGVLSGFLSLYFTRVYVYINSFFDNMKNAWNRLLLGGSLLGLIILIFPALYGEGYDAINGSLAGNPSHVFAHTFYSGLGQNFSYLLLFMLLLLLFKVLATSLTFGAGGIGGIFAPSLFLGSNLGLLFALFSNHFGLGVLNVNHFAFAGMAGVIAANLHAPLTAVFLIGDITGGYQMFIPLMIVSVISFSTVKFFQSNSVYTIQLARRGDLLTHNSDHNILKMMNIKKLIETNFISIHQDQTLGNLVEVIAKSTRNIFPVINDNGEFEGLISMDNIRDIMFQTDLYDTRKVSDLMTIPSVTVQVEEPMEQVADKFHKSGKYNIAVLDGKKYIGFVSRAHVFTTYRKMLNYFSED